MLIGCLSAMLSFGTCNGKRTRFELPFQCCGRQLRNQMCSICMCFQDYYYGGRRKNVSSVAVLTDLEVTGRENTRRGQFQIERGKENLERKYFRQGSVFLHFFLVLVFNYQDCRKFLC